MNHPMLATRRMTICLIVVGLASLMTLGSSTASADARSCAGGCSGHGACGASGVCLCDDAWAGQDCSFSLDQDAAFAAPSAEQFSADGQELLALSANTCIDGCSGHGSCNSGDCTCHSDWSGPACATSRTCHKSCGEQGQCVAGACVCKQGFFGPSCADRECPNGCNGHGTCNAGACLCSSGWAGHQCEMLVQLSGSARAQRLRGRAAEEPADMVSPNAAYERAHRAASAVKQVADQLIEVATFERLKRKQKALAQERSRVEHELWMKEQARKEKEHERQEMEQNKRDAQLRVQRALSAAHEHAQTLPGHEFAHDDKSIDVALLAKQSAVDAASQAVSVATELGACSVMGCSGHGTCNSTTGQCSCAEGWKGAMCDTTPCLNNCEGRGMCLAGKCVCSPNFFGDACQHSRCPGDCSGHGYCFSGRCQCSGSFGGEACLLQVHSEKVATLKIPLQLPRLKGLPSPALSTLRSSTKEHHLKHASSLNKMDDKCPRQCSNRGNCVEGSCLCYSGFFSSDCSKVSCCNGRGACPASEGDSCKCDPGWSGKNCEAELVCLDPTCSGHGACSHGQCICALGYGGASCEMSSDGVGFMSCQGRCSDHGTCAGKHARYCDCESGWTGMFCDVAMKDGCADDCNGHGTCMGGFCSCHAPWEGAACDQMSSLGRNVMNMEGQTLLASQNTTGSTVGGALAKAGKVQDAKSEPQGLVQTTLGHKQDASKSSGHQKKAKLKKYKVKAPRNPFSWEKAQTNASTPAKKSESARASETIDDTNSVTDLGSPVTSALMTGGFVRASHRSIADALKASMVQSETASTVHSESAAEAVPQAASQTSDGSSSQMKKEASSVAEASSPEQVPTMIMPLHPQQPKKPVSAFIGALRVKR
mmetsp:Transcript_119610/g.194548  ORF Transcript_119610/g.194548 Transcript_119610/m.194548 type:complete len:879 (-) Transcript_119610:89-2725(-)